MRLGAAPEPLARSRESAENAADVERAAGEERGRTKARRHSRAGGRVAARRRSRGRALP